MRLWRVWKKLCMKFGIIANTKTGAIIKQVVGRLDEVKAARELDLVYDDQ